MSRRATAWSALNPHPDENRDAGAEMRMLMSTRRIVLPDRRNAKSPEPD